MSKSGTEKGERRAVVEPLGREQLGVAGATLGRSFMADPFFNFLQPKEAPRGWWLERFMGAALRSAFDSGNCLTIDSGAAAVMSLLAPGQYPLPFSPSAMLALRVATISVARGPKLGSLIPGIKVLVEMEERHPKEPHWYVYQLGVSPDRQGEGLGGTLLREAMARVDHDRLPAYLETTNEKNLTFYGRFGFEVLDEMIAAPDAPPVWFMQRPPKPAAE